MRNACRVNQGTENPGVQKTCSHGGLGLIKHPKKRATLALDTHCLNKLKISDCIKIKVKILTSCINVHAPCKGNVCFLCLCYVAKKCARCHKKLGLGKLRHVITKVTAAKILGSLICEETANSVRNKRGKSLLGKSGNA